MKYLKFPVQVISALAILTHLCPSNAASQDTCLPSHFSSIIGGWGDYDGMGIADFDMDGRGDLIAADQSFSALQLYYNVSALGRVHFFRHPVPLWGSLNDGPQNFASGDFDGDGDQDIAILNWSRIQLVKNLFLESGRRGAFEPYASIEVGGYGLLVIDVNQDGALDLVLTGHSILPGIGGTQAIYVFVNRADGSGTFDASQSALPVAVGVRTGVDDSQLAAGDLNGDGITDLALPYSSSFDVDDQVYGVAIYYGDGTTGFHSPVYLESPQSLYAVAIADLNGDGRNDLIIGTDLPSPPRVATALHNGQDFSPFAFQDLPSNSGYEHISYFAAADLDSDGNIELVAGRGDFGFGGDSLHLRPDAGGSFSITVIQSNPLESVFAADFDLDGKTDIVGMHEDGVIQIAHNTCVPPSGACCAGNSCFDVASADQCRSECDARAYSNKRACYGDLDDNNTVNSADRAYVSINIGNTSFDALCRYDLDGNGHINAGDRGQIAANINQCRELPDFQNGSGFNHGAPDLRFGPGVFYGSGISCSQVTCGPQ